MVIDEETLDQMIDYMEKMSPMKVNDLSIKMGEYKGYDVRVMLHKPEDENRR